uniref:PMS1 homolog 1, mismatch repair system component n=1 Tax=Neogobius melanostomus TaxID=47308 RepID=A0A8C6WMR8_9GOBI
MHQLPPSTVRLLSSSQVITSVVNVVKELTENSLDAEATSVDVKLENYGLDRIEVRDNGSGIRAEDTPVMGVRHFTSKISSHQDLESLQTYGFRGEALGSICAVAEVTVTTKTKEDDFSTQYTLDLTGNIVSQKPSHLGQGTTVSVQRLFKNLPVRRQFYSNTKKCKEELKRVQDVLTAFAIVKPELRVTLYHNKVMLWQKSKMADHRSALVATLGPNVVSHLQPFHHRHEDPEIILDGFLPKPGADFTLTSSSSADKAFIYVNDRPVQQKEITKLVRQHLGALQAEEARGRFPTFVLRVSVSAAAVDVNLTPDKTQVLLHHKEALLTAVEDLLVSLYGAQTSAKVHHTEEQPGLKIPKAPSDSTKDLREDPTVKSKDVRAEAPTNSKPKADVSSHCPTSNNSSSSSIAEDWIVDQIPADLSLCDADEASQNCATEPNLEGNSPERLDDGLGAREDAFSAEEWSRGTALRDPDSDKPLQPVTILRPNAGPAKDEDKSSPSSTRLISNAIIEKRAALTAYDVLANRAVRAPLSPAALFEKETRAEVVSENPKASLHQINAAVRERWKTLNQEERQKFEDRAQKHMEHHEQARAASAEAPRRVSAQGQKRKALSNQQLLDELFSAQPQKKLKNSVSKPSRTVGCSLASLRQNLPRLASSPPSAPLRPCPISRLASQGSWLLLSGHKLLVLNPFRVEEALLFQRLMDNNILPAVALKDPIPLTEESLGGAENMDALCSMEKQSPELDGSVVISDLRLVANGFKIKLSPDRQQVQVTAMAECVPFLGLGDLREILTAVVQKKTRAVSGCRPLKVYNHLKGEAVRLVRQMPAHFSREEVRGILRRMETQLERRHRTCLHERPFTQLLCELPSTEQEARAVAKPLDL